MNFGRTTLENMSPWYNRWLLKKISPYLKGEILEVGCGIGNFTPMIKEYGKVTAIDIDSNYLEETKRMVNSDVDLGFGDIEKGKYFFASSKKFDRIICLNVLEHIRDDAKAVGNLSKLLKINGELIIIVPLHQWLYGTIDQSIGHYRRYQPDQIKELVTKNNLKIIRYQNMSFIGVLGWFIAGRLLKKKIISKENIRLFNLLAPIFLSIENLFVLPVGLSALLIARKQ